MLVANLLCEAEMPAESRSQWQARRCPCVCAELFTSLQETRSIVIPIYLRK